MYQDLPKDIRISMGRAIEKTKKYELELTGIFRGVELKPIFCWKKHKYKDQNALKNVFLFPSIEWFDRSNKAK